MEFPTFHEISSYGISSTESLNTIATILHLKEFPFTQELLESSGKISFRQFLVREIQIDVTKDVMTYSQVIFACLCSHSPQRMEFLRNYVIERIPIDFDNSIDKLCSLIFEFSVKFQAENSEKTPENSLSFFLLLLQVLIEFQLNNMT